MPVFEYKALKTDGGTLEGVLDAGGRQEALGTLRQRGLRPLALAEKGAARGNNGKASPGASAPAHGKGGPDAPEFSLRSLGLGGQGISFREREDFARQLSNLLTAGIPLSRALQILAREASSPIARETWQSIHGMVSDGMSLSGAMAQFPRSFPRVQVAMAQAGEAGGFLDQVLAQIAEFLRREKELRGKVLSAMLYPVILMGLVVCVMIFLMVFFIPRFQKIFSGFGASLPLITQVIVGASDFVRGYGLYVALGLALLGWQARRWARGEQGRRVIQRIVLRLPVLGGLSARFAMTRFCHMLGTLIAANVPLIQALRVARESLVNQTLMDALAASIERVRQGDSLASSLRDCPALFPDSVIEMVAVAEETGRLDQELTRLARVTEEELDRRMSLAVSLAEPLLLLTMAALIGFVFVGMVLPIFTMQEYIK